LSTRLHAAAAAARAAAAAAAEAEAAAAARRCRPTGHAAACRGRHLATRNYLRPSPGHDSYASLFLITSLHPQIDVVPLQLLQCGRLLHTPIVSMGSFKIEGLSMRTR